MSLGTAIFLGLVLLGLIWLYITTWQRWRWKRIIGVVLLIILVPAVAIVARWQYQEYLKSFPRPEEEMWELKPGMPVNEVLFRKGEPSSKDDDVWLYWNSSEKQSGHIILIDGDQVRAIEAFATEGNWYRLPTLQGISNYSSQEDIEKRFGKPDHVSTYKDQTRRLLSYMRYGVVFQLEKNRVVALGVFDRKRPLRFANESPSNDPSGISSKTVTKK